MLRTSLRRQTVAVNRLHGGIFLSSNAQDFIEETRQCEASSENVIFLSSNAQDFIEEIRHTLHDERARIPEQ